MKVAICLLVAFVVSEAAILNAELKVGESFTLSGPNDKWTRSGAAGRNGVEKLVCKNEKCQFVGENGKAVETKATFTYSAAKKELTIKNIQKVDAAGYTNPDSAVFTHHDDGSVSALPASVYQLSVL